MHTHLSRSVVQPILDFLFPPLCIACRERLASTETYVCAGCTRRLVRVARADHTMMVLHERFSGTDTVAAFHPQYYFEEEGVLQHIIHALKYEAMTTLGTMYGETIGAALRSATEFADAELIVPVPLHVQKERERGYNQSEWICRGMTPALRLPVATHIVRRRKNTRTQTKLTAAERLANVKDAFIVDDIPNAAIRGRSIILVDDVITTGATIHSCALALRRAGAAKVLCASIGIAKLETDAPHTGSPDGSTP